MTASSQRLRKHLMDPRQPGQTSADSKPFTLDVSEKLLSCSVSLLKPESALSPGLTAVLQTGVLKPELGWRYENKFEKAATRQTRHLLLLKTFLLVSDVVKTSSVVPIKLCDRTNCPSVWTGENWVYLVQGHAYSCTQVIPKGESLRLQHREPELRKLADGWRHDNDPEVAESDFCLLTGIDLGGGRHLVLTAIPAEAGGGAEPFNSTLLGFEVTNRSWIVLLYSLEHSRLPLVLDIDETLVVANTAAALSRKLADAKSRRAAHKHAYNNARSEAAKKEADGLLEAVNHETAALAQDLKWLEEFSETDAVTFDDRIVQAGLEIIDSSRQRPVVRRPDKGIIFTRIDPEVPSTSMAIRIRPGWEELRFGLLGIDPDGPSKRPVSKFEIYICTTAQRAYALEVWRLLDPSYSILPAEAVPHRMINVSQDVPGTMKQLSGALGLGPLESETASPLPAAVIADDRTDVWVEGARGQIAQVEPYAPYRRAYDLLCHVYTHKTHPRGISWLSLVPLRDRLLRLRRAFYFELNEILHKALLSPLPLMTRQLNWPQIRSMAELIRDPELRLPAVIPGQEHLLKTGKPDTVIDVPKWVAQKKARSRAPVNIDARMEDATPTWKFAAAERPAASSWAWAGTPVDPMETEAVEPSAASREQSTEQQGAGKQPASYFSQFGPKPKDMSKKKWKRECEMRVARAASEAHQADRPQPEPATPHGQRIGVFGEHEGVKQIGGWEARVGILRESRAGDDGQAVTNFADHENGEDAKEAFEPAVGGEKRPWARGGGRSGGRRGRGGGRAFRGRGRDGGPGRARGVQVNGRRGRAFVRGGQQQQRGRKNRARRRAEDPTEGDAAMPEQLRAQAQASGTDPYSVWDRQ